MFSNPRRKLLLCRATSGQPLDAQYKRSVVTEEAVSVQGKEEFRSKPAGTLISVSEAMVFNQAKCVSSSQIRGVRFAVRCQILWASECRIDGSLISNTGKPTVQRKKTVMCGVNRCLRDPVPLTRHFAKARKTSRRSCMISSASFI